MIRFCSLFSGSSGNCMFVGTQTTKILVDAGVTGKRITGELQAIGEDPAEIKGIFITHEHSDHICSAGILSRKYNIPIYANTRTWAAMDRHVGVVKAENRKILDCQTMEIGDLAIDPLSIPHDAAQPCAYTISAHGKRISIATDMGHISEAFKEKIAGSELIFLESNHDEEMLKIGSYPWLLKKRILGDNGHLSNEAAGELACYLVGKGTKKILLGHLSKENNFPELAYETVKGILESKGIKTDNDVRLRVAARDRNSGMDII